MSQPLGRAGSRLLSRFARALSEGKAAAGPSTEALAAAQAGRCFSALPEPIEGECIVQLAAKMFAGISCQHLQVIEILLDTAVVYMYFVHDADKVHFSVQQFQMPKITICKLACGIGDECINVCTDDNACIYNVSCKPRVTPSHDQCSCSNLRPAQVLILHADVPPHPATANPAAAIPEELMEMKGIKLSGAPLYLDMQATTPLDPRVIDAMMPLMTEQYGNPHSRTHMYGWESEDLVEGARLQVVLQAVCSSLASI